MKIIYLQTCEYGVPDGEGDYDNCGEPAIATVSWGDGDKLHVCEEHLQKIIDDEEKESE